MNQINQNNNHSLPISLCTLFLGEISVHMATLITKITETLTVIYQLFKHPPGGRTIGGTTDRVAADSPYNGTRLYGSFSEILKISQIFGPTLTIYRYFIALIQFFAYLWYVLIQS